MTNQMKRIIILTLTCFSTIAGYGQITRTHKIALGLGNEWNPFLSPNTLVEDEETIAREELWDNGTYQSLSLKNSLKIEGEKYRLKFKVNGSLGIYQTEEDANRFTYRLGVSYRLKYAQKKYFEFAPELFRKRREGINADNAVLTTPFSYSLFQAPVGLDFYLGNKAWLKTKTGYLYKNYDKAQGEELYYQAPFFEASISKKWDSKNAVKKISLRSATQFRKYQTLSLINAPEEEEQPEEENVYREGSRNWTYQFTDLLLDISGNDSHQKLGIGLYHISRIDADKRSTYHELGPGIQYQLQSAKAGVKASLKFTIRSYQRLAPGSDNDVPLQYEYIRANIELYHALSKRSQIYGKGNIVNRTSNNPNQESLSFRGYFNGYAEIGIRWTLLK